MAAKRYELTEAPWSRISARLPGKISDPGRSGRDNRLFVNGCLWCRFRFQCGTGPPLLGFCVSIGTATRPQFRLKQKIDVVRRRPPLAQGLASSARCLRR